MSQHDPLVTLDEAKATVATKTAPRITEESIKARIKDVTYFHKGTLTIAVIEMVNGFNVVGKAAPASAANFDLLVGERYAYEDAFKQIWQLEGYLLCDSLYRNPDRAARGQHTQD